MAKDHKRDVKIGWSTESITPTRPVQLMGQHYERISVGVHDELYATAVAIDGYRDDGTETQSVIVSGDLAVIDAALVAMVRTKIVETAPDLAPGSVIITATHTHTAPTISEGIYPKAREGVMSPTEYRDYLSSAICRAITGAWSSRDRGAISWTLGYASVGFNRRVSYADGSSRMYGDTGMDAFVGLEGGSDHGVELLYTFDHESTLTGVVVNLACPSQVVENKREISADFWTPARDLIRGALGPSVSILPLCSAAGDQSPRDLVRRRGIGSDFHDYEGVAEIGRRIASTVIERFDEARTTRHVEPPVDHHAEVLELASRFITREEAESIRQTNTELEMGNPDPASSEGGKLRIGLSAMERYKAQKPNQPYPAEIHVIRIGEIVFATNPFELFLEYGLRIKARSAAEQAFIVQLSGDRGLYLPTRRAIAAGSYGTIATESRVGPEGGDELVERTIEIINSMFTR